MSSLQSFFELFTTPESQDLFLEWADPADSILNHFVRPNKSSITLHSRNPEISRRTCVQCIAGCAWSILKQGPYTEHPPIICTYEPHPTRGAKTLRKNCEACNSKHKSCDQVAELRSGDGADFMTLLAWSDDIIDELDAVNDDTSPDLLEEDDKNWILDAVKFFCDGFMKAETEHREHHHIPRHSQTLNRTRGNQDRYDRRVAEVTATQPAVYGQPGEFRLAWGDDGFNTWYLAKAKFVRRHLVLLERMDPYLAQVFKSWLPEDIIWSWEGLME